MVADVDEGRARKIMSAIGRLARAEGTPVSIRHVCLACAQGFDAVGTVQYVVSDLGLGEPVYATEATSERLAEAQVVLGEGPAVDVLDSEQPALATDLDGPASGQRWPLFAPTAVAAGVRAVFAFPLHKGSIVVGVLEIYLGRTGALSADEHIDALLYADAAMGLLLEHVEDLPSEREAELFAGGLGERWSLVYQATGVVSVQLDTGLSEAFVRLRAHAFLTSRSLADVAEDVLAGRLRFDMDD
jgi:hypothetical protein